MKLLFIADGRSPTALNWISYFIQHGDEVHLASSFPCQPVPGLASFVVIPIAMSQVQGEKAQARQPSWLRKAIPLNWRTRLRQWLGPLTLPRAAQDLRLVMDGIKPELVHAMRIPYEGMLASLAYELGAGSSAEQRPPLLISVWGNDFTLHANSTRWMAEHTRRALSQADALHTDCQRDQRLARNWGYDASKPGIVLPGGGGIRMEVFNAGEHALEERRPVVINPRGFRAYVRNDTFFRAIPLVLQKLPEARFLCPTMQAESQAQQWVAQYQLGEHVELLPFQSRQEMAELYRRSQVVVSLTTHDGTPNSLLEAMACGCFPVVGDLESLREWIRHGENGLLVDAGDPQAVANALVSALTSSELRINAASINQPMIRERAEYGQVMEQARDFYQSLINKR
jgi:glycosyltransferase involved in cell wall biosynthesis